MRKYYYYLSERGFANESIVINYHLSEKAELENWLDSKYSSNQDSQYYPVTRKEAEKRSNCSYSFFDLFKEDQESKETGYTRVILPTYFC